MPEEMAFARHNIEKRRLIELVRLNPILWDCRLPHYKRSDKKKAIKWNELGRIFNVNGERVQRTFTSLREIFRRELNHEKLLGNRFKSKWEYYDSMAFLREVIRERKSRERTKTSVVQQMPQQQQEQHPQQHQQQHELNDNNNNNNDIDEYQYFAPNDPNNPINQAQNSSQQNMQTTNTTTMQPPNELNQMNQHQQQQQQQQQQQLQTLKLQSDVILNLNSNALNALQSLSANGTPPPQTIANTHSGSTSPYIYIKDEPDSPDETISLTSTQNDKDCNASGMPHNVHNKISKHYNNNTNNSTKFGPMQPNTNISGKKKTFRSSNIDDNMPDQDLDVDDDPDVDMLDDMDEGRFSTVSTMTMTKHRPSSREILYTKFGDFLAARLNTLQETLANELMNKILLLIAEK